MNKTKELLESKYNELVNEDYIENVAKYKGGKIRVVVSFALTFISSVFLFILSAKRSGSSNVVTHDSIKPFEFLGDIPYIGFFPITLTMFYLLLNPSARMFLFNYSFLKKSDEIIASSFMSKFGDCESLDLTFSRKGEINKVLEISKTKAFRKYEDKLKMSLQSQIELSDENSTINVKNSNLYFNEIVKSSTGDNSKRERRIIFDGSIFSTFIPVDEDFFLNAINPTKNKKDRRGLNVSVNGLGFNVPLSSKKEDRDSSIKLIENEKSNYIIETNDKSVSNLILNVVEENLKSHSVFELNLGNGGKLDFFKNIKDNVEKVKSSLNQEHFEAKYEEFSRSDLIEALIVENGVLYVFFREPINHVRYKEDDVSRPFEVGYSNASFEDVWNDFEGLSLRVKMLNEIKNKLNEEK